MPSKIEWLNYLPGHKGEVWNPVTGCSKVSAGCKNCYAETMAQRFWKGRKFTDIKCHEERLEIPLHWKKPRLVFVNSMSDLFHEKVRFEFVQKVYNVMNNSIWKNHIFLILTKRPERAKKFYEWYNKLIVKKLNAFKTPEAAVRESIEKYNFRNIWLGVSLENQETADERIPVLLDIPAAIRWVSIEPMLGEVDLTFKSIVRNIIGNYAGKYIDKLDWVVLGGESGHKARPMHPEWARKVRDDCKTAGVPFFFKQWGEWIAFSQSNTLFSERRKLKHIAINNEGKTTNITNNNFMEVDFSYKVCFRQGKKYTGRLLDGREYSEYPVNGFN